MRDEFQELREAVLKPVDAGGHVQKEEEKIKFWQLYTKRTFYLPFILVSASFFIANCGGVMTLQTFAVVIFAKLKAPIDSYMAAVLLGAAQVIGTLICVVAIHFTGKRLLSFLSTGGTSLCFLLAAIYGYLSDSDHLDGMRYTWIPTTLMIGIAFISHIGIRLLPWILIGEVFPTEVRSRD